MFENEKTVPEAALFYAKNNLKPIPIPYRKKIPEMKGFANFVLEKPEDALDFFIERQNVGLLLHDGLVEIDLDCKVARDLAPEYLPDTFCIYGRESSPGSHRLYQIKGNSKTVKYSVPEAGLYEEEGDHTGDHGTMLFEYRTGKDNTAGVFCTVPPSTHSSTGEKIMYEGRFGKPAPIDSDLLGRCCDKLAVAVSLVPFWTQGGRQDMTLAIAGGLGREGWDIEEIWELLEPVILYCDDRGDRQMRKAAVVETVKDLVKGDPNKKITGFKKLAELTREWLPDKINTWLKTGTLRSPIMEVEGHYRARIATARDTKLKQLTSFQIEPLHSILVEGEGEYMECNIILEGEPSEKAIIEGTHWNSTKDFKNNLCKYVLGQRVTMSEDELQLLKIYLYHKYKTPKSRGKKTCGFHTHAGKDVFITEYGSLTKEGLIDNLVYHPTEGVDINCKLTELDLDLDRVRMCADGIHKFNIQQIALPVLAWTIACFWKDIILEEFEGFPILVLEGAPGTGKSSTMKNIIKRLWHLQGSPMMMDNKREFSRLATASATNTIPVLFEENKITSEGRNKSLQEAVDMFIKTAYGSYTDKRGTKNQTMNMYKVTAPISIVGEIGFSNSAMLDRIIQLTMFKSNSHKFTHSFQEVQKLPLEYIGRAMLQKRFDQPMEEIRKELASHLDNVTNDLEDRVRKNTAVLRFGLTKLNELLGTQHNVNIMDQVMMSSHYEDDTMEVEQEDGEIIEVKAPRKKRTEADKMIQAFCRMSDYHISDEFEKVYSHDKLYLEAGVHYSVEHDKNDKLMIKLHTGMIFPVFREWAMRTQFSGDLLDERTFNHHIQNESYFLARGTYRFKTGTKKVFKGIKLDVEKLMTETNIEICEAWQDRVVRISEEEVKRSVSGEY